jgi:GH15 family glucan-1,4-alpha-glucosidase
MLILARSNLSALKEKISNMTPNNRHQYDMGIIGNCSYLAYVNKNANVVWHCWPKFDSSFIFGSLLDKNKGGHFFIEPAAELEDSKQYYIENTNVLATEFKASDGRFRVLDFAPRFEQYDRYFRPLMLMRKIERIEGNPRIRVSCHPRGEYGEAMPELSFGSNHIRYRGLQDQVRLTSDIPLNYISEEKDFLLTGTKNLVLSWGIPLEAPLASTVQSFLDKTIDYWRKWIERCGIPDIYQREVIRSSLVLKLHQYEATGAIIASGTTSLPEAPGAERNWDYRFFWLRDTYYTLQAFNLLGQFEEVDHYSQFIQNLTGPTQRRYQPVYSITGENELTEEVLDLEGYLGNKPVRKGNAAYHQVQNDTYGQILLSMLPLYIDRRIISRRRLVSRDLLMHLLKMIDETMEEPDAGPWELRGFKNIHAYTLLFHWAGAASASKIGDSLGYSRVKNYALKLKKKAAEQLERCYHPQLRCYASAIGSSDLDASLFQMITMRYLDPTSKKAKEHMEALEKGLSADGKGLFYRYKHRDDFGTMEVAFLVCGFWYVRALAAMGRVDDATQAFENLMKTSNHLGLLSEDVSVENQSQWGNFVQTYSHVGVINSAFDIARKIDRPNFL